MAILVTSDKIDSIKLLFKKNIYIIFFSNLWVSFITHFCQNFWFNWSLLLFHSHFMLYAHLKQICCLKKTTKRNWVFVLLQSIVCWENDPSVKCECVCARASAPAHRKDGNTRVASPGTQTGVAHSRSFRLRPSHLPSTENSSSFQEVKPCWLYTCPMLHCRPPSPSSSPPPPHPLLCLSLSNLSWFWLDLMQQAGGGGEEGPSAEASPGANPSFMDPPPTPASFLPPPPPDRQVGGD